MSAPEMLAATAAEPEVQGSEAEKVAPDPAPLGAPADEATTTEIGVDGAGEAASDTSLDLDDLGDGADPAAAMSEPVQAEDSAADGNTAASKPGADSVTAPPAEATEITAADASNGDDNSSTPTPTLSQGTHPSGDSTRDGAGVDGETDVAAATGTTNTRVAEPIDADATEADTPTTAPQPSTQPPTPQPPTPHDPPAESVDEAQTVSNRTAQPPGVEDAGGETKGEGESTAVEMVGNTGVDGAGKEPVRDASEAAVSVPGEGQEEMAMEMATGNSSCHDTSAEPSTEPPLLSTKDKRGSQGFSNFSKGIRGVTVKAKDGKLFKINKNVGLAKSASVTSEAGVSLAQQQRLQQDDDSERGASPFQASKLGVYR